MNLIPEERYCRKDVSDLLMRMMMERMTSCVKCSMMFSLDRNSAFKVSISCNCFVVEYSSSRLSPSWVDCSWSSMKLVYQIKVYPVPFEGELYYRGV